MIDLNYLKQLDQFSLLVNKRITSRYVGERKSMFVGHGLIFQDYTPYTMGDDFKKIDWKVYGRTDKLFIKRFEEERNLVIHIIIDFSGSMNYGSTRIKKSDFASMIGLGFAYLALKNNEKFVLSTFGSELEIFKPKKGIKQMAAIFNYLNNKKVSGITKFEKSLSGYKNLISSRSLVVIISDLLYSPDEIKSVLSRLSKHDVKVIQVLDINEENIKEEGNVTLKDSETGQTMKTFISRWMKQHYLKKLDDHRAEIQKACDAIGAEFYHVNTGTDIFDAFFKIIR